MYVGASFMFLEWILEHRNALRSLQKAPGGSWPRTPREGLGIVWRGGGPRGWRGHREIGPKAWSTQ